MSIRTTRAPCSRRTRRGRPCRNPAARGTNPPVCRRHDDQPAPAPSQDRLPLPDFAAGEARPNPPAPAPSQRRFHLPDDAGADLRPEIELVRSVLRRITAYLDESAGELPAEEVRRLAGLTFSGARTVAYLLAQRTARPDELRHWLADQADSVAGDNPSFNDAESFNDASSFNEA